MKKTLLVFALALTAGLSSGQTTVWQDNFDDADISDWTILNLDGNPSTWQANNNLTESVDFTGPHAVLATYNYDFVADDFYPTTGIENNFWLRENNWAITPAIDLSSISGIVNLIINAQTAAYDADNQLVIFASNTLDQESFVALDTIMVLRPDWGSTSAQFNDYTIDVSSYAGQAQVYFAITTEKHLNFVGNEIDQVSVVNQPDMGISDASVQHKARIGQNPVADNLKLKLSNTLSAENTTVNIFSTTGTLLKQSHYDAGGINVSELSGGIYFVQVVQGATIETLRFIKK